MTNRMGRLTKDKIGFSMPASAPLYQKPPFYYTNVESLVVVYETDEEAALELLPEGLELQSPPTAAIRVNSYPFSTFGAYNEIIIGIACLWQGEPRFYPPFVALDQDAPFAGGREIWGVAKKLAHIEFRKENELFMGSVERPRGNRLCTVIVKPESPLDVKSLVWPPAIHLRVIPSPEEGQPPSLAELVELPNSTQAHEWWGGQGSVCFDSISEIDPWYRLKVKRIITASYSRLDLVLKYGKIIKRY